MVESKQAEAVGCGQKPRRTFSKEKQSLVHLFKTKGKNTFGDI